jgi:hypothetical protein
MPSLSRRLAFAAAALLALVLTLTPPAVAQRRGGYSPKKRYILVFEAGTSAEHKKRTLDKLGLRVVEDLEQLDIIVAEHAGQEAATTLARARKQPKVAEAEEDFYINWIKSASSLQEGFQAASGFTASFKKAPDRTQAMSAKVPWGIARVGAPAAWDRSRPSTLGAGVSVAVIDTGVNCSHPNLKCDASQGYNAVDPEALPIDDNDHGTHVAGIIAGKGAMDPATGENVFGVAPLATIVPVKVLDDSGGGALSDVVRGINWAARRGVNVINMSLGSPNGAPTLKKAVEAACGRGVTVVAASGNSGDAVNYPGAYDCAIAVAASDKDGNIPSFSCRGPQVAFAAPGVAVNSALRQGYGEHEGTSMAAPHVAGLAALALATHPGLGPSGVKRLLAESATRLCQVDRCPHHYLQGSGMPNAAKLVDRDDGVFASLSAAQSGGR